MKIGLFTDSYLPNLDGVSTSVAASANELEKLGHTVYIIAPRYKGYKDQKKNVIRIFSIKVTDKPNFRLGLQIPQRSLVKVFRNNFDIIHAHAGGPVTFLGWQISQLRNIPYIATYHTMWSKYSQYFLKGLIHPKILDVMTRLFGNVCDNLIVPTNKVKRQLRAYGVTKPIYVVPSGIQLERYSNVESGFIKHKLKIPQSEKILLSVGRLSREKSMDFLIRAFKHISIHNKHVSLVLVGEGMDSDKLKDLSKQLGIQNKVYFFGTVDQKNMHKVYADADLFVFASQTETQGLVIVESLASGVPVVAVKDGAFKDVVIDGYNGYLVNKSIYIFAQQVLNILEDSGKLDLLSKNAMKSAELHSAQKNAVKLEKIYKDLISKHIAEKRDWVDVDISLLNDVRNFFKLRDINTAKKYLNIRGLEKVKDYIKSNFID